MAVLVIAAAVYAIYRRVDVRVSLLAAALLLGLLAGQAGAVGKALARTLVDEKFIVPIGSAMAFARVLRFTGCDRHLVLLLTRPLVRVRPLLVPGSILVGFLVNIPVISQTSTAVAVGSVMIPVLLAAGLAPATAGAALLLGSSLGGELLNPGAPELETVSSLTGQSTTEVVARLLPLDLIQLATATAAFWLISRTFFRTTTPDVPAPAADQRARVSRVKAAVPVVPLVLLFLVAPPLALVPFPKGWLVNPADPQDLKHFDSRLVGVAMVFGAVLAALVARSSARGAAAAFGRGVVYAYVQIISLIVVATGFAKGVEVSGLARALARVLEVAPGVLVPAAGALPLAFAALCGSGMASTQGLFPFFAGPARDLALDPVRVGAVVSIGAAAGRTMSPVAAVTLMCAALTGTPPTELARRVAVPLLVGLSAVLIAAYFLA